MKVVLIKKQHGKVWACFISLKIETGDWLL